MDNKYRVRVKHLDINNEYEFEGWWLDTIGTANGIFIIVDDNTKEVCLLSAASHVVTVTDKQLDFPGVKKEQK